MYVKIRSIQPRFNQLTVNWVNKIWCLYFLPQRLDFVDFATGSLGQGLSCACGMAYTGKYFDKARWNVIFYLIWFISYFFIYELFIFGIFWSKLKGLYILWITDQVPSFLYICWVKVFIYLFIYLFFLICQNKIFTYRHSISLQKC